VSKKSLAPQTLSAVLNAEGALAASSLSKQDLETIKLLVSELTGCDYCVAAHTLLGKLTGLSPETLKQIRAGQATGDAKRDALVRFVRNLHQSRGTHRAGRVSEILSSLVSAELSLIGIPVPSVSNRGDHKGAAQETIRVIQERWDTRRTVFHRSSLHGAPD
jgi:AhpD family alkylhydroperoxidase